MTKSRRREPLHYPYALEQAYRMMLQPVVDACQRETVRTIIPALPGMLPIMDGATVKLQSLGSAGVRAVIRTYNAPALRAALKLQATKVDDFQRRQLHAYLVKHSTVSNPTGGLLSTKATERIIDKFVTTNVELVKSIPPVYFKGLEDKIKRYVREGIRAETLAKELTVEPYGLANSKANLIARDQTAKLHGQLNKTRQTALGIKTYIWRTMGDERVREMHQALEGKVLEWGDPPETNEDGDTNDPGGDYQCRCTAEPNLDELD